ncbi:MAG: site-2 protease family protein [Streptosporangiaceae bacterium]
MRRRPRRGPIQTTIPLGRIAGVRVGANWSVFLIFALIAYGLAVVRFPSAYPGHGWGAYVLAGLVAAVVFFGSLLAHEMAHAILARRHGVGVDGITLWLFGGVARLRGEASTPAGEFRIAGVGPLVSLLVGGIFIGILVLAELAGVHGLAAGAIGWLGGINIVLALFNVIPAAPLDGGRLLRAFLWWRTGDRTRATIWSSRAGQGFGWLLVALGVASFFITRSYGGLWIVVIGWFLISAAGMEGRQARARGSLDGMAVWQVMTPQPVTVPESMPVEQILADRGMGYRHRALPVVGPEGEPVGVVTFGRMRQVAREAWTRTAVRDLVCPLSEVPTVSSEDSVAGLVPRLSGGCAEGRALVIVDGQLVGIVTPSDVARAMERMNLFRPTSRR